MYLCEGCFFFESLFKFVFVAILADVPDLIGCVVGVLCELFCVDFLGVVDVE